MKIFDEESQSKFALKLLSSSMLENQIKELKTTRSCPTGYSDSELKSTSTIELLHLRKETYEYLNLKSSKTRNVQFILLVQRINKELERRNVNIPISTINIISNGVSTSNTIKSKSKVKFDEISHYMQIINDRNKGEYCYLTRKRGVKSTQLVLDSVVLCNSHFSITKNKEKEIPEFLQDRITKPLFKEKQSIHEFEIKSSQSTTELSSDREGKSQPDKSISECLHYEDLGGLMPSTVSDNNHPGFDADEVLFLFQHN